MKDPQQSLEYEECWKCEGTREIDYYGSKITCTVCHGEGFINPEESKRETAMDIKYCEQNGK